MTKKNGTRMRITILKMRKKSDPEKNEELRCFYVGVFFIVFKISIAEFEENRKRVIRAAEPTF